MTQQEPGADVPEVGWRVIDPDGNVVDSGPGVVLVAADNMADPPAELDPHAAPAAPAEEV